MATYGIIGQCGQNFYIYQLVCEVILVEELPNPRSGMSLAFKPSFSSTEVSAKSASKRGGVC